MRPLIITLLCCINAIIAQGQELYIRTFGDSTRPALIFLHGGPGYNSAAFEATTPQRLADSGFFVIVYDRRGEGRSKDTAARYTFAQSNADLLSLYRRFGISKAALLGHSFGGMVGTKFATANPDKVSALVLISAPVDLQASFRNIIDRCRTIYLSKGDSTRLQALAAVERMDTASLMYSTYCFGHAIQNGFYTPKNRSAEAKAIFDRFRADTALFPQSARMDFLAPKGFWEHEHYTTLDLRAELNALRKRGVPVYGLYGKEDGLYSIKQVAGLHALVGDDRLVYLENCSHNVFIDQQERFVTALTKWLR